MIVKTFIPIVFAFTILLISGCSCDNTNFRKEYYLNGFGLASNNDSAFFRVGQSFIHDSILFLTDAYDNPAFHIYNIRDMKKLGNFGEIGKGKNEIDGLGDVAFCKKERAIWLIENNANRIRKFSLDSLLKESSSFSNHTVKLPAFDWIKGFGVIDDSTFLLGAAKGRNILFKVRNGEIIDSLGQLPAKNQNYSKEFWYYLQYQYGVTYNPNNMIAVVSYIYYDKVEFFDIANWKHIATVDVGDNISAELRADGIIQTNRVKAAYHCGSYFDDNYIYLGYNGNQLQTKIEHPSGLTKTVASTSNIIHIYDYSGNKKCKLVLDSSFGNFVIDRKHRRILTFGFHQELSDGMIREYPMTAELLKTLNYD